MIPTPLPVKRFQAADTFLGHSLQNLCIEGPPEALAQDLNAQLGIYTISAIVTDLLKTQHLVPDLCSGYSSGFYAAAYAAGCFDFLTGLLIVKKAGNILLKKGQALDGGMAVIFGLPHEQVLAISRRAGPVDIAIRNAHRQIVISGFKPGIEAVMAEAMREGALRHELASGRHGISLTFQEDAGKLLQEEIDRDSLSASSNPPLFLHHDPAGNEQGRPDKRDGYAVEPPGFMG